MNGSWRDRYPTLSPAAREILHAMAWLDVAEPRASELAVVLELDGASVDAALVELREHGWLTGDHPTRLVPAARTWLVYDTNGAETAPTARETDVVGRFIARHAAAMDLDRRDRDEVVRWVDERRADVLGAIRAGTRVGLCQEAAGLARRVWAVAQHVVDPAWWQELAAAGERAATRSGVPEALLGLLNRSAAVFDAAGHPDVAEDQWKQALKLCFELGDHHRVVTALTTLARLYRRVHRLEELLDIYLELADAHQAAGNQVERADALAELAYVYLEADRPSDALARLERADELLDAAPPESVSPVAHARIVEMRGRTLWLLGQPILARRMFGRAVDLLGDRDPEATARVRALLDVHVDAAALPPDPAGRPGSGAAPGRGAGRSEER